MTVFPALIPSSRVFTPGEYPHTAFRAWNGLESRVRHSNVMLASTLRLTFVGLTEANMLSILNHYVSKRGEYLPFPIPSQLLSGVSAAADYTLAGYQWRYAEPPVVDDIPCAGHSVEVLLESVPFEAINLGGLDAQVLTTFAPGGVAVANGITAIIATSLVPGMFGPEGAMITVESSIEAGTPEAGASIDGFLTQVAFSIISGAATVPTQYSHDWASAGSSVSSVNERFGFTFTVGAFDIPCKSLGLYARGTGAERVRIHRVSDGQLMATADISGIINQWVDVNISTVTLLSGVEYVISSRRVDGGTRSVYRNPSGLAFNTLIGSPAYRFGTSDSQPTSTTTNAYVFMRFGFQ